jgi:F-type H+-transporting ATPase subunit gamma
MSGTAASSRRKIASAVELKSVVRSMKALAASSIGQYETAVRALADYYRTVELGLAVSLRQAAPVPLGFAKKGAKPAPIGAVLFGSDQGLVGRFNEVLAEFATRTLEALPGKTNRVWAVGERIHALVSDTGLSQSSALSAPTSVEAITLLVGELLVDIEAAREKGEVVEVYLFHNCPKSGAVYQPVSRRILPLDDEWQKKLATLPWPTKNLPEVIEGGKAALQAFVRGYLFVVLFQASAESLASENASRLAAMQRAEDNINDILEELNRTFHRIRQDTIDEELFDVISGYEALSQAAHKRSPQA